MTNTMPPVAQFSLPTVGKQTTLQTTSTQNQTPTGMPPVAQFSLPNSGVSQTQTAIPGHPVSDSMGSGLGSLSALKSNLAKTPGELASAGNAVAPIAADISNDVIGKNTKTFEQQSGDALKTAGNVGAIGATVASGGLLGPEAAAVLAPTSFAGLAGSGAALGAAQTSGSALQQNASAGQVAQQGTMGALVGGVTGAAGYGLGKLLNTIGVKSATLAVRPSAADFADGYDSQFSVDNGLTGNAQQVADKTKTFMQSLATQLKTKLAGSNAGIDLAKVFDDTKAELTSQGGKEANFLQNSNLQGALSKLENEVLAVNPSGELPLLGAQTIKQQTGMYGEWLNGAPDPEANAMGTVANTFYRNLKSAIEEKFPTGEIADINGQLQKAIPIMRAAIRRVPVVARSSALSLTDMLGALGFSSNPATLALPAFQHAMNSGLISKVATPIANIIPKIAPVASSIMPGLFGKVLTQNK